jgi:hypothetical protein
MYSAYSIKNNKIMNIHEVTDLNDTFTCPNEQCSAEYFIKAICSEKAAHFCHNYHKPHIPGCIYAVDKKDYQDNNNMIKSELIDIYEHERNVIRKPAKSPKNKVTKKSTNLIYINSTKALLSYCLSNDVNTIYDEKKQIAIKDFFVDARTVCNNSNFEGVNGLKFLVGNTTKYNNDLNSICFNVSTITSRGKKINLHATVILSSSQFFEIKKYIFNTFKKFSGHSIAVLGIWEITEKYNVLCSVNEPTNVVYKFTDEIKL